MGILHEIQTQLTNTDTPLGSVLLKLRLLAAKLGSVELEEWIKHEAEGYPSDVSLPSYRSLGISFTGSFSGPFGSGVQNAPIPPFLIQEVAGEKFTRFDIRDSASTIDVFVSGGDGIHLDLSNLMLLIKGKIYPDFEPIQLKGYISHNALVEVSNTIRNKLLEFTIELERRAPESANLSLHEFTSHPDVAANIYNNIINRNITNIVNSGDNVSIDINVTTGDAESMKNFLVQAGLEIEAAEEISSIVADEPPDQNTDSRLGARARAWLADRITRGTDEGIKGGVAALSRLIQDAALSYYGLK